MKELLVLRHAKSRRTPYDADDVTRPLNKRGERSAPAMGRILARAGLVPDLIISSPASRAFRTAELAAEAMGYTGEVRVEGRFYFESIESVFRALRGLSDSVGRLLIVGHNPTFEELVWRFVCDNPAVGGAGLRLPTACLVLVNLFVDRWSQASPGCGQIEWSMPPRLALKIAPDLAP